MQVLHTLVSFMRYSIFSYSFLLAIAALAISAPAQAQLDAHTGRTLVKTDAEPGDEVQAQLEARERHRARMKAHRKRIIETGKNDHAETPEEYSPELEEYSKFRNLEIPVGPSPQGSPAGFFRQGSNSPEPQAELSTDIRLEREKPAKPAAATDQYVSKQMHSEYGSGQKVDMKPYLAEVSRRIKASWFPPAREENKIVGLSFLVMPSGAVANLLLTKSSGSPSADEAARHAVLRAAPFAPLPKGCTQPQSVDYSFEHAARLDNPSYQPGVH